MSEFGSKNQNNLSSYKNSNLTSLKKFEKRSLLFQDGYCIPSNANNIVSLLPEEIILQILINLDFEDVLNTSLLCKRWNLVVNNEPAWKYLFLQHFSLTSHFTPISGSPIGPHIWRNELIRRSRLLEAWSTKKGERSVITQPEQAVLPISDVYPDFSSHRLTCISARQGTGCIIDPSRGRRLKNLIFSSPNGSTTISSYDVSRFAVVFGLQTGTVTSTIYSFKDSILTYKTLERYHNGPVTSIWVIKSEEPRNKGKNVNGISGAADGTIYLWNLKSGDLIENYQLKKNVPITHIYSDSKCSFIIAVNSENSIFILDRNNPSKQKNYSFKEINLSYFSTNDVSLKFSDMGKLINLYSDKPSKTIIFIFQKYFVEMKLLSPDDLYFTFSDSFDKDGTGFEDIINSTIDPNQNRYYNGSDNIPGFNARLAATAHVSGNIRTWDVRAFNKKSIPTPLRIISTNKFSGFNIKSVSMNSLVLLSYMNDGKILIIDLLSGVLLRTTEPHFPIYSRREMPEFCTQIVHVDENPLIIRAISVVDDSIRTREKLTHGEDIYSKTHGIYKKRHMVFHSNKPNNLSKGTINKIISSDLRMLNDEEKKKNAILNKIEKLSGGFNDMTEEEQIAYAKFLSETAEDRTFRDGKESGNNDISFLYENENKNEIQNENNLESLRQKEEEDTLGAIQKSLEEAREREKWFESKSVDPSNPYLEGSSLTKDMNQLKISPKETFDSELEYALKLSLTEL